MLLSAIYTSHFILNRTKIYGNNGNHNQPSGTAYSAPMAARKVCKRPEKSDSNFAFDASGEYQKPSSK